LIVVIACFSLVLAGNASASASIPKVHRLVPPLIFAKVLRVHRCEEGTNWYAHGLLYFGGLGWLDATWQRYKLPGFPARADLATPQQQARAMLRFVTVAEHGWWPDQNGCTGGY
jgi:hypothetical protein